MTHPVLEDLTRRKDVRLFSALDLFVLEHGKVWMPKALPDDVERGPSKLCFTNATKLTLARSDLRYCEGLAFSIGFPMHHAWCVDEDGGVVDPTWSDPQDASYLGVTFPVETLIDWTRRNGVYGLLDTGTGFNTQLAKDEFGWDTKAKMKGLPSWQTTTQEPA